MPMDELAFQLEKFRRDTQELLNATDALIAIDDLDSEDGKREAAMFMVRLIGLQYAMRPLGSLVATKMGVDVDGD